MRRQLPSTRTTAARLRDLDRGTYVELDGVIRSVAAVESVISGAPLLGYQVLCSVFGKDGYAGKHEVSRWSDAVLEDETGEVRIGLDGAHIRAPAMGEVSLDGEDEIARTLAALGIEVERPEELQLLERGARDGARVTVRGVVDRLDPESRGAFRTSARPPLGLCSRPGAPIVIVPG